MRPSASGSTLLEVCVVVAVMGVMLSVAAFSVRGNLSETRDQRRFGAVVRSARMRAMRSGDIVSVAVNHAGAVVRFAVRPTGLISADDALPPDSSAVAVLWEANANHPR